VLPEPLRLVGVDAGPGQSVFGMKRRFVWCSSKNDRYTYISQDVGGGQVYQKRFDQTK
jgi:hypothetical protein